MRSANDTLPALFLADDPDEVLAAAAAVAQLSSGRLRKPETINRRTGKPERDGLYCARTFGPVDDHQCLCGKLTAPASAGQRCDKCGVLCGGNHLRGERWGHLESPVPLLHPRLAPRIARQLGCTAAELHDVFLYNAALHPGGRVLKADPERFEAESRGPLHVAGRLGERASQLLLTHIPVTPPAWRGTRRDPQDDAYARLLNRCNRLTRLLELDAPDIILDNERRMTQEAFDRLYPAVRAELSARGPLVAATHTPRAQTLLHAIYDDPDSDAARRAYAAHLTDEGDLRGEFITSQLANARRSRPTQREADLLRRDFDRYLGGLADAVEPNLKFRRGFPSACKTTRAAATKLDDPAWSTLEHLDTDLAALIRSPATRSLVSLTTTHSTLCALLSDDTAAAPLPRIHTLHLTLPRCPPPLLGLLRTGDILPGLRTLTIAYASPRGDADWTWLPGTPLIQDLEHLTITTALDRLPTTPLPWWTAVLADHPRLKTITLVLGKRHIVLDLRRDRGWISLRIALSRAVAERIAISDPALADQLSATLTALGPHDVMSVRLECPSWFSDDLENLARDIHAHFGPSTIIPRT